MDKTKREKTGLKNKAYRRKSKEQTEGIRPEKTSKRKAWNNCREDEKEKREN
jgi:hypothetical protein